MRVYFFLSSNASGCSHSLRPLQWMWLLPVCPPLGRDLVFTCALGHLRLTKTNGASLHLFYRWYDQYSGDVQEWTRQGTGQGFSLLTQRPQSISSSTLTLRGSSLLSTSTLFWALLRMRPHLMINSSSTWTRRPKILSISKWFIPSTSWTETNFTQVWLTKEHDRGLRPSLSRTSRSHIGTISNVWPKTKKKFPSITSCWQTVQSHFAPVSNPISSNPIMNWARTLKVSWRLPSNCWNLSSSKTTVHRCERKRKIEGDKVATKTMSTGVRGRGMML